MHPLAAALAIRQATLDARMRTKDDALGVATSIGMFQVQRVTYRADGASIVQPLTGWTRAQAALNYLHAL